MALLDVSDVLDDPDFWSAFTVARSLVVTHANGLATRTPTTVDTTGVVVPGSGPDLIQTADGQQLAGDITIYTRFALTTGDAQMGPDVVTWDGAPYRVIAAKPWLFGSGFTEAVLKLATLNPSSSEPTADAGFL